MYEVIFKTEGGEDVKVFAAGGENVLDLARKSDVFIDAPCSGNGTCGKCRVKLIGNSDNNDEWQLACQLTITVDTTLFVPDSAHSYIKNISIDILGQGDGSTVLSNNSTFGLAIDIGTTTVSALLVDMSPGDILAKATTGNAQIRYGADVINRIIQQQKPGGIKIMQDAIVKDTLLPLIDNLCTSTGINPENITRLTVAANTTMNHLLLGVDANSIRIEPYEPAYLEFEPYDPSSIGIHVAPDALMYIAPNIGSYVGGDITAGITAAVTPSERSLWKQTEMNLLIDLGTNGEIVFGDGEFLMACACSAGPAFEGGDISCGMRATDGAIEAFTIDKDTMTPKLTVIGGGKPIGLCGSGLIDVVAELFRTGIINSKGKFNTSPGHPEAPEDLKIRFDEYGTGRYILAHAENTATNKEITISEVDIDNFIRAKGAIFSGIMSLLEPLGFIPADIDNVLIAGGIGSGINIKNAISIGMLPDLPPEKYNYIGNSSLTGAYMMLTVPQGDEVINNITKNMTYIDLSTQPDYMTQFIAACFLPHTDETLFPSVN